MKQDLIIEVMQKMATHLDNFQMKQLQSTLESVLCNYEIRTAATESLEKEKADYQEENWNLLTKFLAAKRIEGCSEKTLKYYRTTIEAMQTMLQKSVKRIMTEDLRQYLTDYQERRQSGRVTMDNIRRILSSYFAWLEDEDFIIKVRYDASIKLRRRCASKKLIRMKIWNVCEIIAMNFGIWLLLTCWHLPVCVSARWFC